MKSVSKVVPDLCAAMLVLRKRTTFHTVSLFCLLSALRELHVCAMVYITDFVLHYVLCAE